LDHRGIQQQRSNNDGDNKARPARERSREGRDSSEMEALKEKRSEAEERNSTRIHWEEEEQKCSSKRETLHESAYVYVLMYRLGCGRPRGTPGRSGGTTRVKPGRGGRAGGEEQLQKCRSTDESLTDDPTPKHWSNMCLF
jgi:hypothetical protein